ncbi:MAG TPA: patatin-like phospholipase family protein [Thermoanaerobaculia bacterium]|jgi:NTE family protein
MTLRTVHPRLAVALSGGGFRAALFHAGVLVRVAEAGWLPRLDLISTVSGGSILGAVLATKWEQILRKGASATALREVVVAPFTRALERSSFIGSWGARLPLAFLRHAFEREAWNRTSLAAELLSTHFDLSDIRQLPESPYLVVNASNLLSGRSWRFTRDGCGDSRFGYARWRQFFSVGAAVAASAAFPPVFSPLPMSTSTLAFSGPVYGEQALPLPALMPLSDGGVYDNLGVEVATKTTLVTGRTVSVPEFLLVSDGGFPAQQRFRRSGMPAVGEGLLLYRVDEVARDQVGALRRRMLVRQFQEGRGPGALIVLGSSVRKLPASALESYVKAVGTNAVIPETLVGRIQSIRTHLNRFSETEAEALMYHGYTLTDAVLHAYRDSYDPAYQLAPWGDWRIEFTPTKIEEWERGLSVR